MANAREPDARVTQMRVVNGSRGSTGCFRRTAGKAARPSGTASGASDTALRETAAPSLVAEDDGVLAGLQHDLEVTAADGGLRPPAVDHTPLLPDHGHRLPIHLPGRSVKAHLDECGPRPVQHPGSLSSIGSTVHFRRRRGEARPS